MTQKELVDQFCEFRGKCTTDDVVALNFAYEMLAPRWISVKDELPPKYDSYLTRSSGNVIEITHYNIDGWHTESKGNITHWMPLPSIEGIKGNQGETSPNEKGGEE